MPESNRADTPLASGTMTLLFTDIEGSTRLWEEAPEQMRTVLAMHDTISRSVVESHRGVVVKMTGDGIHAAFDDALDALAATVDLQMALTDLAATSRVALRVRCGLHAGLVERRDNDYFGGPVNRAARIMSAAHGGQVLLSQAVADDVREILPTAISLRDLGKVRLKDLSTPEHVYQVVHPQLRQQFPALRSLEATPNNLPQQTTSFIGREKELGELRQLLAKTRLLTLTGSGGCGKTRLCLQLAADSLDQYPDGAWLVEFASLTDHALVPPTVATVLGLKEEPGKPISRTLSEHLKDRRLLLLLDNCEHLLAACAQLVDVLLRQCPHLRILVSSREALGPGGEQAYRVPSLSLPDPKRAHTATSVAPFEAVQLFTDRALLARPDFQVTDQNAGTLASICYRLDGVPLAIELAAARVRSLSVEAINRKLDQRFLLLTGGSRTTLPRQQTLRSLIDWSYDLLQESEKLVLQRFSVFAGGWTLTAAEQICAGDGVQNLEVLDLLSSLVDKSLVVVEEKGETYRYRLLETVRQYARERLLEGGGGKAVRDRHLEFFLMLAEETESRLTGPAQAEWLQRLQQEHENLRVGLEWSLAEGEPNAGMRLCGALWRYWWLRGHLAEGREWCARVLQNAAGASRTAAFAVLLGTAGILARYQGDYAAARALNEESLSIRRALGDRRGIALSLINLGGVAHDQRDFAVARAMFDESLVIVREVGDRWLVSVVLNNLGDVAYEQGDLGTARRLYEENLAIKRELGDRFGIANALVSLGFVAQDQGDYPAAGALSGEGLAIRRDLGDLRAIPRMLEGRASWVAAVGGLRRAARIFGAAERLREEFGSPQSPNERHDCVQRVTSARTAMGDDAAFDRAWHEGRALTLEQAIELALDSKD